MSLINSSNRRSKKKKTMQKKEQEDCLICLALQIMNERPDVAKWIATVNKPTKEITELAYMLSGIHVNEELIQLLQDPLFTELILS